MDKQHQKTLEQYADNMRFILDAVCQMTDERNSETAREQAAFDLIDRDNLYKAASECREIFRTIANNRTDKE